ncbi:MAG: glycosyltransferase [Bacteroidales bacterium]|jgi:glycosyltransferase involved in cell wall biosynthesis|nr:glycosyltransferase [Bacteroidales bacterium]
MKKVSIIVPVYNIEKYIGKCLNSLVNQTLKDIEIIIVNDGSLDNSDVVINNYKKRYADKIVYIKKKNGGLSDARNTGISYAKGEYIACVDGDDYVTETMYEKLYNSAKKENADLVECNFYNEYPNKLVGKIIKPYDLKEILIKSRYNAWNKIIKRELLEIYNIRYPISLQYEDVEYFCKLVPYVRKIAFIEEPLYYYVQRDGSIVHIYDERTKNIFTILDNILMFYKGKGFYEKYKDQLEYVFIKTILGGSFFRMVKIHDKNTRIQILYENWEYLNNKFPNWKKNETLRNNKTLKNMFFRSVNATTYYWYAKLYNFLFSTKKCLAGAKK